MTTVIGAVGAATNNSALGGTFQHLISLVGVGTYIAGEVVTQIRVTSGGDADPFLIALYAASDLSSSADNAVPVWSKQISTDATGFNAVHTIAVAEEALTGVSAGDELAIAILGRVSSSALIRAGSQSGLYSLNGSNGNAVLQSPWVESSTTTGFVPDVEITLDAPVASNTPPTVDSAIPDQNLDENFASYDIDLGAAFEDAETADADLTYTVSGNTNIGVSIAGTIATISNVTSNWEGSETLVFRATDDDASPLFVEDTVEFNVAANVSGKSYVTLTSINATADYRITAVADLEIGDRIEGDTLTTPPSGDAAITVTYNPDGSLSFSGDPAGHSFQVRVLDSTGIWGNPATQAFPANTALTLPADESVDVQEGAFSVGNTSTATGGTTPYVYSLENPADQAVFSINSSTGKLTFLSAPDYETATSYSPVITVTDDDSNTDTQTINITITNVLEETITDQGPLAVELPYGVTGLDKTDSRITDWYALWTDADTNDYASQPSTLLVSNSPIPSTFTKADAADVISSITLTNAAAIPPSLPATLNRNVSNGSNSITFPAATGSPTITYALSGTDAALFNLVGLTATLISGVFDSDTKASYSLTLTASSIHGADAVQAVTLSVVGASADSTLIITIGIGIQ